MRGQFVCDATSGALYAARRRGEVGLSTSPSSPLARQLLMNETARRIDNASLLNLKRTALLIAMALGLTLSRAAGADGETDSATPPKPSPKRPLLDYRGRGSEPTTHGEVALWIPRIVLSPLYLVSEYVIRWPLSVAMPAAEHDDLPRKIYDLFTFGPEHKAGVTPVGFAEFNFNPSVGLYAFWDDAGFTGDDLRLHVEAWPTDWVAASLVDRIQIDSAHTLELHASGIRRPDHVFYGLGPTSLESNQSRYGEQQVDAGAVYEWRFWRSSRIQTGFGVRNVDTYDGHYGNNPTVTEEAAARAFRLPAGFGQPYTAVYDRALVVLDSRVPANRLGSGARLELAAEQGSDVEQNPASGWIRYGATLAGYVDLNGRARVLGLSVTTQFADPLGSRAVPFTEMPYLGGDHPMAGYYTGRMVDRSAASATMSYAWPVGPWLDGRLEFAAGNVFDSHLAGLDPSLLRLSAALGLSVAGLKDPITGVSDAPIEFLVGVGSETFSQGTTIDSVRVMFGVPHTF